MKFLILSLCSVLATAKPHVYLYNGAVEMPVDSNGRVIDAAKIAEMKAAHLEAQGYPVKVGQGYQGPPAPLNEAGQVVDTPEVAQLKAERIAALEQATAAALAAAAAAKPVHIKPLTVAQTQQVPTFMLVAPGFSSSYEHQYHGPQVSIGQHNHGFDREEVMRMTAAYFANLAKNPSKDGAGFSNSISSSSGGYSNQASTGHQTQGLLVTRPFATQNHYDNPLAPVGEHVGPSSQSYSGEHTYAGAQQTQQLSLTRPADVKPESTGHKSVGSEQATSTAHVNSQTVAVAATPTSSPSYGEHSYVEPTSQQTHGFTVTQPQYNDVPTSTGGQVATSPQSHPQGLPYGVPSVQQTQQLATSEQTTSSAHTHSQTVAVAATPTSSPSYGEHSYVEPASQQTHGFTVTQPQYNDVPTSTGGHVATSPQSHPQGLPYGVPSVQQTQQLATSEQATSSAHTHSQTVAVAATPTSSPSCGEYSYVEPASQQTHGFTQSQNNNFPTSTGGHIATSPQSHPQGLPYEVPSVQQSQQLATSEQATSSAHTNSQTVAVAAAPTSSPSYGEHSYVEPASQQTHGFTVTQPQYNNVPTSTGGHVATSPQSHPQELPHTVAANEPTQQLSPTKPIEEQPECTGHETATSEQATSSTHADSQTLAIPVTPSSFPSTGVNSYQEPASQQTHGFVTNNPSYVNPLAPTGEHIASSSQSQSEEYSYVGAATQQPQQLAVTKPSAINPHPVNLPASTGQLVVPSPQSNPQGYSYPVPATQLNEEPSFTKPVAEKPECTGHECSWNEQNTTVPPASSRLATAAATPISSSSPVFLEIVPSPNFGKPLPFNENQVQLLAQPQTQHFNVPTSSQAVVHRSNKVSEEQKTATQVTNFAALNPIGSSVYTHAPVRLQMKPLKNNNHQLIVKHAIHSRPTYDGPLAPLDSNGNVIDTEEVAALKAEHLAILERANAQAIKLANAAKLRKPTPGPTYSSPKN